VRALIPTIVREQVKHLLYEHQNNVAQLKEAGRFRPFLRVLACTDEDASAGEMALKLQQEEHRQHEAESKRDKRSLKLELKELELAHEDAIRELKQENDKNVTKLRQQYEREVKELQQKYEKKMKLLREDLELRRKVVRIVLPALIVLLPARIAPFARLRFWRSRSARTIISTN